MKNEEKIILDSIITIPMTLPTYIFTALVVKDSNGYLRKRVDYTFSNPTLILILLILILNLLWLLIYWKIKDSRFKKVQNRMKELLRFILIVQLILVIATIIFFIL